MGQLNKGCTCSIELGGLLGRLSGGLLLLGVHRELAAVLLLQRPQATAAGEQGGAPSGRCQPLQQQGQAAVGRPQVAAAVPPPPALGTRGAAMPQFRGCRNDGCCPAARWPRAASSAAPGGRHWGAASAAQPARRYWMLPQDIPHPCHRPARCRGLHGGRRHGPGPATSGGPLARPSRSTRLPGALTAGGSSWSARGRQGPVPAPSPSLLPRVAGLSQNSQRGRAGRAGGTCRPGGVHGVHGALLSQALETGLAPAIAAALHTDRGS